MVVHIPLDKESIPKTAIAIPFGLFEFTVMAFGLNGASQSFQRSMDRVLHGLDYCFCYIDDIIIWSHSSEEHEVHLREVLSRLETKQMFSITTTNYY